MSSRRLVWLTLLHSLASADDYCKSMHADFLRRQKESWDMDRPFIGGFPKDGGEDMTNKFWTHETFIKEHGGWVTATVGPGRTPGDHAHRYHPMKPEEPVHHSEAHFITHIYVMNQNGDIVIMETMDPTVEHEGLYGDLARGKAQIEFPLPRGATQLKGFAFCNQHGLWEGKWVQIEGEGTKNVTCKFGATPRNAWHSTMQKLQWRMKRHPHNKTGAYNESDPLHEATFGYTIPHDVHDHTHEDEELAKRHIPVITMDGAKGFVDVIDHPMVASTDPEKVHFITHLYVLDQFGHVVALKHLNPEHDKAHIRITIPRHATELTAFSFCNRHGLWKGKTVKPFKKKEEL